MNIGSETKISGEEEKRGDALIVALTLPCTAREILAAFAAYRSAEAEKPLTEREMAAWVGKCTRVNMQSVKRLEKDGLIQKLGGQGDRPVWEEATLYERLERPEMPQKKKDQWQLTEAGGRLIDTWYAKQECDPEAFGNTQLPRLCRERFEAELRARRRAYLDSWILERRVLREFLHLCREEADEKGFLPFGEDRKSRLKPAAVLQQLKLLTIAPDEAGCTLLRRGIDFIARNDKKLVRIRARVSFNREKFEQWCARENVAPEKRELWLQKLGKPDDPRGRQTAWIVGQCKEDEVLSVHDFQERQRALFRVPAFSRSTHSPLSLTGLVEAVNDRCFLQGFKSSAGLRSLVQAGILNFDSP